MQACQMTLQVVTLQHTCFHALRWMLCGPLLLSLVPCSSRVFSMVSCSESGDFCCNGCGIGQVAFWTVSLRSCDAQGVYEYQSALCLVELRFLEASDVQPVLTAAHAIRSPSFPFLLITSWKVTCSTEVISINLCGSLYVEGSSVSYTMQNRPLCDVACSMCRIFTILIHPSFTTHLAWPWCFLGACHLLLIPMHVLNLIYKVPSSWSPFSKHVNPSFCAVFPLSFFCSCCATRLCVISLCFGGTNVGMDM
ncbi:hypothetical protein DUNSADRAFT_10980 [Dunaliella salina]|uniref:Encoded protein n=1 Tax=Dunaliella salina TaxID=3046 RepID=A0ABQ7GEC3_DUNSA|nr:hypothetical protein DUNSADRAFT_10980 [Dunaliella salina]|eukprot:KAF5832963.1 hypothetical protein DUNSADRAFT_10980 [Dunaliella salina]